VSDLKAPSRAWQWLGIHTVDTGDGTATVVMKTTDKMANHAGFVHGGMISTLADSAMGRSVRTVKPSVVRAMSFDLKVSFISAVKIGDTLRATGRVVHAGRRTVVTECRIEGSGGKLVATASGTFAVTREKEDSASTPLNSLSPEGVEDKEQI
jgi:uncharacterized protein (TIGR00369 family)